MSSPTADRPARRQAPPPRPAGPGIPAHGGQLRFVRAADIDAYADEVARLLKSTIRQAVPARSGGIDLPAPEDLVRREVSTGAHAEDTHSPAIADSALVDAVGPSWSMKKVRAELGDVSSQAVHQRVDRGTLWALPTRDGATVFPTFQFARRHGDLETKPSLRAMFKILRGNDPWAVAVLLNTPAPELDDRSPVEWERRGGDLETLTDLAHSLVREWNRP